MGKVIPLRRLSSEAVRITMKPRRRRWNWRRAVDSLLTLAGIAATGMFLAYLALGWMLGVPW